MHDFHEADKIFKVVLESAKQNNLKKVKQINIKLGSVVEHGADITAENLEFNLKMLTEGTIVEGSTINIEKTDGNSWELVSISGE
jgi:Zn finger protein HypA/HybF involved in hydrogenase expression